MGMLMTADGTGDDLIKIQGLENYTFTDEDGGEPVNESDEEEPELFEDVLVPVEGDEGEAEEAEEGEAEEVEEAEGEDFYEGGSEEGDGDSSEDDDTNEHAGTVRTSIGEAMAPAGFTIVDICPGFATTAECQQFTGQLVLVGWDTDAFSGWFVGTIHSSTVSARDKLKTPMANYVIKYTAQRTGDQIVGNVACELSPRLHGKDNWWVLIQRET